jgi:single-stranded-DNA-specific exonuclease
VPPSSTPCFPEAPALWRLRQPLPGAEAALAAGGRFPAPLAGLLAARGYADPALASAFLASGMADCHDPRLLWGMDLAVDRLAEAWRRREKVAVFGDYDVDGVTSTVLLVKLFTLLGMAHEPYIPDRFLEGYGPNAAAFRELKARGAAVLVTVDCGINSMAEALEAKALGLDLIITDHHLPGPALPVALAVVNPQTSPAYPYPMLGGVGVAYKLAQALLRKLEHPKADDFLDHMLELVALGTVCDVAPLDGENRALVRTGIARIRQGRWLGLRSLAAVCGVDLRQADAGMLGFQLGPRLNAGGRVGDAMLGVKLLLSKDPLQSRELAGALDAANRERRGLEKSVVAEATARAEQKIAAGARSLVLWDAAWHPGVVGLAASRLLERFQVPSFVFAVDQDKAKGSGRSRKPFNLVEALRACAPYLLKYGGHEVAAGASAALESLPAFAEAFEGQASRLSAQDSQRVVDVDLEVRLRDIDEGWMGRLEAFEPHGSKNPRPSFLAKGLKLGSGTRAVGEDGAHLKLELRQGGAAFQGIAFKQGSRCECLLAVENVDAVFHLGWNTWNGVRSIQMDVRDLRPSEESR